MQYNIDFANYSQADANFNSKSYLLVPNQRLVRKLIGCASGNYLNTSRVSEGYYIYSLTDFINQIFALCLECGLLPRYHNKYILSPWQREILFRNIINDYLSKDDNVKNILSASTVYAKAVQAWSLGVHWQLDWQTYSNYLQPESNLFYHWAREYQQVLDGLQYCDPDEKINMLLNLFSLFNGQDSIKKIFNIQKIDLFGFDDLSPLYLKLFAALKNYGISINSLDEGLVSGCSSQNIKIFTARDFDHEVEVIASWAHANYQNNIDNIGIIVPNLGQQRSKFTKVFSEKFDCRDAWNISGGEPLSVIPVVKVAVLLLDLLISKKISLKNLTYILQSNYYLKPEKLIEANSKVSVLIRELKQLGYKELNLTDVFYYVARVNEVFVDKLKSCTQNHSNARLPSQWAILISQELAGLGWPAGPGNTINSFEFQAINQWEKCLHELSLLDTIYGSIELSTIFYELKTLLDNKPFQIETNKNAIDILGMLEGAGLIYKQLWICNLTSEVWPALPDPNPFIPLDLQKQYILPHSTVDREVDYAKKLTKRYLTSADSPIISYSKHDGERENNLSLLLYSLPMATYEPAVEILDKYETNQPASVDLLQYTSDNFGPQITSSHIKAGIKALSLQVTCPFKAFAEVRLGANRDYALDIGPASWLRGQVIHDVLHQLYKIYDTKQKIIKLADELNNGLKACVLKEIIIDVICQYKKKYFNIYKLGIVSIETEIISKIIRQLLDLEVHRDDYIIESLEQNCLIKLEHLQFNVRVDRVDKVLNKESNREDNQEQLLIIDYKTNYQNINDLFKDQLVDPQLPVYLFLDEFKNCSAVVYAELMYHEAIYNGIGSDKFVDGCIKVELWDDLKNKWYGLLNAAAKDFAGGNARLSPLNGEQTCRSCHLARLCRKDEQCQMN